MKLLSIPLLCIFLFTFNEVTCQKLKEHDLAPVFTIIDRNGNTINLHDYKGKKVFLAFLRYAGCPVCNFRVHELIENYESIQAHGYLIIAVFESDNTTLQAYLKDTEAPFAIIGDPTLSLYKKYGVEKSFFKTFLSGFKKNTKKSMRMGNTLYNGKKYKKDGSLTRIPADFIIDESGRISKVYYGKQISDHLPLNEILN